jgi:nicotinamidase-related amidase
MRFSVMLSTLVAAATVSGYTFTRLDKNNAVLLVVDHQLGLSELVRDFDPTVFRQSIFAHAALGKLFNLPTILTTSADTGPNGALPKEIVEVRTYFGDWLVMEANGIRCIPTRASSTARARWMRGTILTSALLLRRRARNRSFLLGS